MRLSACLTIHSRETPVLAAMFGSLREQPFDEMVVVLDRSPKEVEEAARDYWRGDRRVIFTKIEGPPGWGSPVPPWNRAFEIITGDVIFAFSSEVVHAPENIANARRILAEEPNSLVFGKASCSCGPNGGEVNWGGATPSNLLVDAAHPRPLGFIWAGPAANVRKVGGMDPEFAKGFWYDDDDFFIRLWRTGLDFIFDDSISGVHLHHPRPGLATPEGQAKIAINAAYMQRKHGTIQPWAQTSRFAQSLPGRTVWRHL